MASFTAVTVGNNTLATDINQYANALNGTTSAGVIVSGGASSFVPYEGFISSAPVSGDSLIFYAAVTADTVPRAGASIRSDGFGMFKVGSGSSVAANWYGISGGWKTDQNVTIAGTLNVSGTATFVGIVASGTSSLDNGALTTSGTGTMQLIGINLTNGGGGTYRGQTGGNLQAFSKFTGSGTGTFSHGLGIQPTAVNPTQNTSGSQTQGFDSATSTQVHITCGNGSAFAAMAYNI